MKRKTHSIFLIILPLILASIFPLESSAQTGEEIFFTRQTCDSWDLNLNDAQVQSIFGPSHPINQNGGQAWFEVYRSDSTTGFGGFTSIGQYQGKGTTFSDYNLPNGSYYYEIYYLGNGSSPSAVEFIFGNALQPDMETTCDATINVTSNISSSWTISPGSINGSGTSDSNIVSPSFVGTSYTITPASIPGYTASVSNTDGSGSSMILFPGNTKQFSINYTASPGGSSVDLKVGNNGSTWSDGPVYNLNPGQNFWYTWSSNNVTTCNLSISTFSSGTPQGVTTGGTVGPLASSNSFYPKIPGTIYAISCGTSTGGSVGDQIVVYNDYPPPVIRVTFPFPQGHANQCLALVDWDPSYTPNACDTMWGTGSPGGCPSGWFISGWKLNLDELHTPSSSGATWNIIPAGPGPNSYYSFTQHFNGILPDSVSVIPYRLDITQEIPWRKSNIVLVSPPSYPACQPASTPPPTPTMNPITLGACGTGTLTVSWSSSVGAENYTVARSTSMNGTYVDIATVTDTSYNDSGLTVGGTYFYKVKANNSAGSSDYSSSAGAVVPSCDPTVSLTATPASVSSGGSTTLTWSSDNSSSCSASASPSNSQWTGSKALNNFSPGQTITNLTATTQFTLLCTSIYGGTASDSKTVTVGVSPPTADITGKKTGDPTFVQGPVSIPSGSTVDLSWNSTNATRCLATGGWWVGTYGPSGTLSGLGQLSSNASFGISCDNGPSTTAGTDSVSFTISAPGPDLTAGNITPTTAETGTPVTFTSTITNGGSASTGSSFNNRFQLATQLNGGGTVSTISVNSRAALNAGASGPVSSSAYTFTTPSSTYSVQVCADQNSSGAGTITESDESNNCSSWRNVIVSAPAPSFDYSLSNSGSVSVTKTAGNASGQATITKTLTSGSTQSVDITATGMPAGVSVSYSNRTCSPTCQSTVTFTVPSTTAIGTYPITITGTPGNKTTNFNLIVNNPSSISASCSVSPSPVQVGKPVTWSVNVIGGSGSFTYAWSGTDISAPVPTTASFQKTYSTTGTKTANVVVTDTVSGGTASCPAGVTGQTQVQVQVNPIFEEF